MKHKWLRNFDADGNWTKPTRMIIVDGVQHDLDEYAKEHGIELPGSEAPKSKKQVNTDIEEKHADMEQSFDQGDSEVDGTGDSEGSE